MEFGKLPNIENVNWSLPADDPTSTAFLSQQENDGHLQIYFGTPAWGHKEWIGKIYPPKTKATDFLFYYSRYFNTIELNTSHYRIPTQEQTQKWIEKVPPEFCFCPKIYQGISHSRGGLIDKPLLKQWLSFLEELGEYAGPSFLQLPPYFEYHAKAELFEFLKQWPDDFALSLEFRHPSWFQDARILPALTQYLQSRNIGLVITDVAGRRDVLHSSIGADFSMVRFIGNDLHPSDYDRAQNWTKRFKIWEQQGLKTLYLFIHEPDDILAPEMTTYFLDQLKSIGQWNLKRALPTEVEQTQHLLRV